MKRTLLFAMLTLLGGAPAFAHEGAHDKTARVERLAGKLGLDDAQKATLEQTFEKFRAQMAPLREQAHKTREALSAELASPQPNQARVASLTDQLQKDRREMFSVMERRQVELKRELTPTQYAKLMLGHHGRRFHGKQK